MIVRVKEDMTVNSMFYGYSHLTKGNLLVACACDNIPNGEDSLYVFPNYDSMAGDDAVAYCLFRICFDIVEEEADHDDIMAYGIEDTADFGLDDDEYV